MRLWHKNLIKVLPRQQLLSQWRECVAISKSIEKNGTPNHILVNKIMDYPLEDFISYSYLVFKEMVNRDYKVKYSLLLDIKKMLNCYPLEDILFENNKDALNNEELFKRRITNIIFDKAFMIKNEIKNS